MKNNKGVTLVALAVLVVLIITMASLAVYTGINSIKVVKLQKYRAQMQLIQNGLNEFYAKYENFYELNEEKMDSLNISKTEKMELYLVYSLTKPNEDIVEFYNENEYLKYKLAFEASSFSNNELANNISFWKNVAKARFDIATDRPEICRQYYYLSTKDLTDFLGIKDIDICDNFIINIQKRYVFSEIPIEYGNGMNIYCLYELTNEEKVINFKVNNTKGELIIESIEKTPYYQKLKLTLKDGGRLNIDKIYFTWGTGLDGSSAVTQSDNWKIENYNNYFEEVKGIGTGEVTFKVINQGGAFTFLAIDSLGNEHSGDVLAKNYEIPILEEGMIPFIAEGLNEPTDGIVYSEETCSNINKWYNYSGILSYGMNDHIEYFDYNKYATAILIDDDELEENGKKFSFSDNENSIMYYKYPIVKIWIPKTMYEEVENLGFEPYELEFEEEEQGKWVLAKWDEETQRWVPRDWDIDNIKIDSDNGGFTVNFLGSIDINNVQYRLTIEGIEKTNGWTNINSNRYISVTGGIDPEKEVKLYVKDSEGYVSILQKDSLERILAYSYDDDTKEATVLGFSNEKYRTGAEAITELEIPAYVIHNGERYNVTAIGTGAFENCSNLTSVGNISNCTNIGAVAFKNCSSLTSVGNLSNCTEIGLSAFEGCGNLISIGDISNCTSVGITAFYNCTSLANVNLRNCTSIGNGAFQGCSNLTAVGNISNCRSIGNATFEGCESLTSVNLSNSCTSIGINAFENCSNLTSVGNISSCTSIGIYTFHNCEKLSSVNLNNSCTSIDGGAFQGCTALTSVGNISNCRSIGNATFEGCESLTSVNLSNSCTSIGINAFENCSNLTSVGDISGCTSIGLLTFASCTNLASINLSNCTSIGNGAFEKCYNLSSIGSISNCTSIGAAAFKECNALTTINIPECCQTIRNNSIL